MKSKMTSYDFFPFVKPSGEGVVVFPNYDTIMKREDIILKPSSQPEKVEKQKESIDDLGIDFEKLNISRGRQTKTSGGYNHGRLREIGKDIRLRGYAIDFTSKDSLIDSIMLLK
tara:strand:+ start:199 stop:540 length:342 start_codon:yes stop_codon:yes gene_type:complete